MTDSGSLGPVSTSTEAPQQVVQVQPSSPDDDLACNSGSSNGRLAISDAELGALSGTEFASRWRLQDVYINGLEQRLHRQEGECTDLQQQQQRQRCQLAESQQREKVLVRRLAAKEQEMQDLVCQLAHTKLTSTPAPTTATSVAPSASSTTTTPTSLRNTLLDPAVNALYTLLRNELHAAKARLDDTQHELAAWKFTPDSNTGKRLMAKCRLLHQENEELGRMTSGGRIAMLEGQMALQRGFSEEVRQTQTELDTFLADLEEDVEGMQSTIMLLQQELRRSKEQIQQLEKHTSDLELQLQTTNNNTSTNTSVLPLVANSNGLVTNPVIIRANGDNTITDNSTSVDATVIMTCPAPSVTSVTTNGVVEPPTMIQPEPQQGRTSAKRVRRSSVLSIDYECEDDEDGMLVISSNGDVAMSDAE